MKKSQEKKPKNLIKEGDCFRLGNHRLVCGSSLNPDYIDKLLGKEKIKAIITDVPYGVSYTESKAGFSKLRVPKKILNDDIKTESNYAEFTYNWLSLLVTHLERKNSIYIFNSDKMIFALREGMKKAGVNFAQLLIWIKNHSVIGRKDYLPMHELIAYGWYGTHEFKKSKDKSVLYYPKPNKSSLHPTMKPLGLIRHLILNCSNTGEIIFDGFLGSGTCLLACEQTKRICYGVELDLEYCQTIIDRFEESTGVKAEKI